MTTPDAQAEFAGLPAPWTKDDTQAYLTAFPLPVEFTWPGRDGKPKAVCNSYSITEYGKWLRETPYFPGLFEAIHDILLRRSAEILAEPPELPAEEGLLLRELRNVTPKPAAKTQTTPSAYSV